MARNRSPYVNDVTLYPPERFDLVPERDLDLTAVTNEHDRTELQQVDAAMCVLYPDLPVLVKRLLPPKPDHFVLQYDWTGTRCGFGLRRVTERLLNLEPVADVIFYAPGTIKIKIWNQDYLHRRSATSARPLMLVPADLIGKPDRAVGRLRSLAHDGVSKRRRSRDRARAVADAYARHSDDRR